MTESLALGCHATQQPRQQPGVLGGAEPLKSECRGVGGMGAGFGPLEGGGEVSSHGQAFSHFCARTAPGSCHRVSRPWKYPATASL